MLRIRRDQMEDIQEAREAEHDRRLLTFFRQTLAEETAALSDEALLPLIARACEKARGHGIQGGEALAKFVGLALLISPDFDEEPNVRRYLALPDVDPDFKMDLLSDLVAEKMRAGSPQG